MLIHHSEKDVIPSNPAPYREIVYRFRKRVYVFSEMRFRISLTKAFSYFETRYGFRNANWISETPKRVSKTHSVFLRNAYGVSETPKRIVTHPRDTDLPLKTKTMEKIFFDPPQNEEK